MTLFKLSQALIAYCINIQGVPIDPIWTLYEKCVIQLYMVAIKLWIQQTSNLENLQ